MSLGGFDWTALVTGEIRLPDGVTVWPEDFLTVEMLREAYPRWWFAKAEDFWFAFRAGVFPSFPRGPGRLLQGFVTAGDLRGLAVQVACQEWLRTLGTDELEAVWRRSTAVLS